MSAAATYEHILYQQDGAVLTVTLNRPDKLNAYTVRMGRELADAFRRADEDDSVRVVIVTGAGRGFCAGADISAGAASFDTKAGGAGGSVFGDVGTEAGRVREHFVARIFNCRKPSICAINGAAVGVGITLTLPMDIRIAAKGAKIGFIFARRGLVPEAGSAWFLPRIVGLSQAMQWCLTGRIMDADEALRGGLVSEVVAPEALLARAREIAREIAEETSPIAIALTRQMLWRSSGAPDPFAQLEQDGPLSRELGGTADVKEGVQAFIEKRKPKFPGRVSTDMPARYPWWKA
jgi:enoyl-CoA hydratase/carnithine racemase